jgi:Uma2 family endonuclease
MSTKTMMTMEQFLALPDEESYRYELWQGELIDVGETTVRHNWVREKVIRAMGDFLEESVIGGEVFAETGIQFDTNTLARPDVVYWDAQHFATMDLDSSPAQVIPQLIAEVVSPSNSLKTLFRNAEYYLRAGVQVVWVFGREPFEVYVFEQGQPKRVLRLGERLEAPTVLPGFSEEVARFAPPAGR